MNKFCFVIDSMSTTDAKLFALENVKVLSYFVTNNKNHKNINDEFTDTQKDQILDEIENQKIIYKTSFLPAAIIQEKFEALLKDYEKIIYLCAAEGYTGQFPNAESLMELDQFKNRLWIFNTQSIASTIESLLYSVIDLCNKKPDVTYDEINNLANDIANRSITLFSPKNLIGMVNSGRIPPLLAKIMKLTKIHPVIKCEEKNKATGIVFRKWPEAINKLCEGINKIFKNKVTKNNIYRIYFYSSILLKQEIEDYIKKICSYFNIDKNIIELRTTPLPIIIYTLKESIGIGVTLKEGNYKIAEKITDKISDKLKLKR